MTAVSPDAFQRWTPTAQEKALAKLQSSSRHDWRPFWCKNPACDGKPHDEWTWNHARADQRPPTDLDWFVWLLKSGRGAGKTRTGSEYTHRMTKATGRLALVARTGPDGREVMVEGESGVMNTAPPGKVPKFEPSKRRLTWPNGAIGTLFSAEEPDRLRGPEHGYAWIDEPAHWDLVQECWDNLLFGLRIGARPRVCATTTPKPRKWVKQLAKDPTTRISTASTYDNLDNLAPVFAQKVLERYENTRLGRQELYGDILEDVEGALWTWDHIEAARFTGTLPPLVRILVGIDPSGGGRDETGIVVVGSDGHDMYVLDDRSGHYTPNGWATVAIQTADRWGADALVAERNYGGDMVENTLRMNGYSWRIVTVHAKRAKQARAEPIFGLYEQGRAHHCGLFNDLETQMTEWVPGEPAKDYSPDRLDAMVYAATAVMTSPGRASIASPVSLQLTEGGIG